jgi:HK97 family phage major capsid protein
LIPRNPIALVAPAAPAPDHGRITNTRNIMQTSPRTLGMSKRELEKYSLARAILAAARGRLAAEAGFELEVSRAEALVRGLPEPMGAGAFYVPDDVLRRDMTAAGVAGSNLLVGTDTAPRGIIGATLQTMGAIGRLGVQIEAGMVGSLSVPAVTVPPVPAWLAADGTSEAPAVQPTLAPRTASPKTVAAVTTCSHQLLAEAPGLAERLVLAELSTAIAGAADTAFLQGSGANGQPQGIVGTSGVGSVTGTSLAYAGLLEFQSDVLDANALRAPETFGYVTTPAVAKLLAGRQRFTGTDSPLWQGQLAAGTVAGARAIATGAAPASTLIAGDFSTAIVFLWPGLLLGVDPYTGFRTGAVTLRALLALDFVLLRPAAFSVASSIT